MTADDADVAALPDVAQSRSDEFTLSTGVIGSSSFRTYSVHTTGVNTNLSLWTRKSGPKIPLYLFLLLLSVL